MKIKLTPLNIVSALCLVLAVWVFTDRNATLKGNQSGLKALVVGFSLLAAVIAFISDLIFRKMILSLGRLWAVQTVLIIFIIILIYIIKFS